MAEQNLREVLDELHRHLDDWDTIDDETRTMLREAKDDIEEALAEPAKRPRGARARNRLTRAIEELEADHPDAVALMQRVLHALSNVGI